MQSPGREPSMEDILASIKKVIQEEKDMRTAITPLDAGGDEGRDSLNAEQQEEDVLELDEPVEQAEPADLGPPLLDEQAADESRRALAQLGEAAASAPTAAQSNPLEDMIREMLRPVLKQWVDEHLPQIVDEHVKREISRITGRKL